MLIELYTIHYKIHTEDSNKMQYLKHLYSLLMQKYEEKLGGGRNQLYICFAYTKH